MKTKTERVLDAHNVVTSGKGNVLKSAYDKLKAGAALNNVEIDALSKETTTPENILAKGSTGDSILDGLFAQASEIVLTTKKAIARLAKVQLVVSLGFELYADKAKSLLTEIKATIDGKKKIIEVLKGNALIRVNVLKSAYDKLKAGAVLSDVEIDALSGELFVHCVARDTQSLEILHKRVTRAIQKYNALSSIKVVA